MKETVVLILTMIEWGLVGVALVCLFYVIKEAREINRFLKRADEFLKKTDRFTHA